jgi:polar amino acid transport system substrate-binding protein
MRRLTSFFIGLFFAITVHSQEPLVFPTFTNTMDQIGGEILKIAYDRIDIQISLVAYPGKRSLHEANLGNIDGEIQRVIGLENHYPNLVRVPTPVNYVEPYFFSKNKNITLDNCQALENHSVGIVRGIIYQENCAKTARKVVVVDDFSVLMKLIDTGRIDIAIAATVNGLSSLTRRHMTSVYLISPPPLKPIKLYHYLHKKNAGLVPKIDQVLKEMEKSGEIEEIRNEIMEVILTEERSLSKSDQ